MRAVATDELAGALARIVGAAHVLADPSLRAPYETDWTRRFSGSARLVVRPAGTAELAAVVDACREAGAALVPQGGNTGLVGGGVPRHGEVLLSTTRLGGLGSVDPLAAQVTVGAGATLAAVQAHAAPHGLDVGVDLGARDSATIGGMVATNAGGVHVLRHGSMRARVAGVEAVLAGGQVLSHLAGLRKDNTGFDLAGLLTGSEGVLGVVTRVRLQLVPRPARRVVALLGMPGLDAALRTAVALRDGVPSVEALEFMDAASMALVRSHAGLAAPVPGEHPVFLLVACGAADDPLPALTAALAEPLSAAVGTERADRAALWAYREHVTEAVGAAGVPHKLDVTLPLPALPAFADEVRRTISDVAPGARALLWGHLGDGNVHVNVLDLDPDDDRVDDAVLRLVIRRGGSISAEHGIGVAKTRWLPLSRTPEELAAMRAIKNALDPCGLLNPGVLLPAGA